MLPFKVHYIPEGEELACAHGGRQELGGYGGQRRARNSHADIAHKDDIENDIEPGGKAEILQRADRVSEAPQNAGQYVIIGHAGDAEKVYPHIVEAHIVCLGRGVEHGQHGRG